MVKKCDYCGKPYIVGKDTSCKYCGGTLTVSEENEVFLEQEKTEQLKQLNKYQDNKSKRFLKGLIIFGIFWILSPIVLLLGIFILTEVIFFMHG